MLLIQSVYQERNYNITHTSPSPLCLHLLDLTMAHPKLAYIIYNKSNIFSNTVKTSLARVRPRISGGATVSNSNEILDRRPF